MRAFDFLLERNLLNVDEIDPFVARMAELARTDSVRRWLSAKLPGYLRRRYDRTEPATVEMVRRKFSTVPDWADKGLRRDNLEAVVLDEHLAEQIRQTIDYLESEVAADHNLSRLSPEVAIEKSQEWHRWLALQAEKTTQIASRREHQASLRRYSNGFEWVELSTPICLDQEGQRMGHCVGGGAYDEDVASGSTRILSLRDSSDQPHVTVEVRGGRIVQVKGRGNRPPVMRYRAAVLDLLRTVLAKAAVPETYDLHALDIYHGPSGYGSIDEVAEKTELASGHVFYRRLQGFLTGETLSLIQDQQGKTLAVLSEWSGGDLLGHIRFHAPANSVKADILEVLPLYRTIGTSAKHDLFGYFGYSP